MPKKKYLCLQRSLPGKGEAPPAGAGMYTAFNAWVEKFRNSFVDMGGRLKEGKFVTTEGIMDGPYVETKEVIGGYMIVSAESLEEAIEVARQCPGLVRPGSGVEVREILTQ